MSRTIRLAHLGLVVLVGCSKRGTGRPQVGAALPTEARPFYRDLKTGLQLASDSLGIDLQAVLAMGTSRRRLRWRPSSLAGWMRSSSRR